MAQARTSLLNDGYLEAQELVAIRAAEEVAMRELNKLLDTELKDLLLRYEAQREDAVQGRTLMMAGSALSLG